MTTSLDGKLPEPLVARLQQNADGHLLFLINHASSAQAPSLSVRVADGSYTLSELITGRRQTVRARDGRLDFATSIGAREVEVWSIRVAGR